MISVATPDGGTAEFPDGTPPEKIKAALQKKFPPTGKTPAAAAPSSGPATPAATDGSSTQAPVAETTNSALENSQVQIPFTPISFSLGDAAAAMNTLGDTASFGIAPAIRRTIQNALSPGSGETNQAQIDAVNAAHPLGVGAGLAASVPVSAMLTAPIGGIGAEGTTLNALARGGGFAGDLARSGVIGAAAGGTEAAAHGQDASGIATTAALGAALGPVASTAAAAVGSAARAVTEKVLGRTSAKAWRYIAKKLGASPDDMESYVQDYATRTGQQPTMQQVVSDHDAGVIAQFGSDFPHAGQVLRQGALDAEAQLPTQAQAVVDQARTGLPASPIPGTNAATSTHADLLNARGAAADAAMAPIEATPVNITVPSTQVRSIMRRLDPDTRAYVHTNFGIDPATGDLDTTMTVRQIDDLRRDLDSASFGVGLNKRALGELSDALESQARQQVPEYGTMIDNFAAHSRYVDGFGHGASGAARGSATDPGLRAALGSAEGESGYKAGLLSRTSNAAGGTPQQAGNVLADISRPGAAADQFNSAAGPAAAPAADAAAALRTGSARVRATAPGALRPQPEGTAGRELATAVAEAGVAPISAARQGVRGIYMAVRGLHLPRAVQQEVAGALTSNNPAMRAAAIEHLRRAGVSANRLRQFQNVISRIASTSAASAASTGVSGGAQ